MGMRKATLWDAWIEQKDRKAGIHSGGLLLFSCPVLSYSLATLWTVVHQALLSTGFPMARILEWLPFPSPGDLPDPGFKPMSPAWAGGFFTIEPPGKPIRVCRHPKNNPEMCIIETSTRQEC